MKTVGDDSFYNYYIQYHYFKNVKKNCTRSKNYPVVRKSTSQVDDFTLDTCLKCGSYPIKTVGGDRF